MGLLDVMVQPEDEAVEEVVLRRDLRLEITLWPQRCEEACSQIWPGGLVLSHYLVEGRGGKWASKLATSPQQRIIELGSGTGICGMTAAALGGRVIATDLAECLPILSKNLAHNTVTITQHGGSIEAAPLRWGDEAQIEACYDRGPFDLVLLCDCMYHTGEAPEALVKTVLALPGNPEVLVCNERRARTNTIADGSKPQVWLVVRSCSVLYSV